MKTRGPLVLALVLIACLGVSAAAAAPARGEAAQTTRDSKGVWSITGDTAYDVFEAQGYAVATDRLWQIELYFRSGRGRLSEIFGSSQLGTDMFMRTIGYSDKEFKKGFKSLSKDAQSAIDGYVHGLNRRVDEVLANQALVPFEYKALSAAMHATVLPQHWTRYDCMAWIVLLQREFDPEALDIGQLENGVYLQTLEAHYGEATALAMFSDLRWLNDPEALTYIPPPAGERAAIEPDSVALARLQDQADSLPPLSEAVHSTVTTIQDVKDNLQKINAWVHMGSYAWVVSGHKTADGNPILYSGPQMGFSVPSITVEGALQGGGLNVSGMTVPGIPAIIIGRTPHHAWSMQVGHAHSTDYYVESVLSVKPNGKAVIHVAGAADVVLPIWKTSHGPIINPMPLDPKHPSDTIVSWKCAMTGHEWTTIDGFLGLARATSMDQFGAAIDQVAVSQHYTYADKAGNIAYWMSGLDPVRDSNIDPRMPIPGDGKHEWVKPLTYKPRSTDRNNAQGYYCGWNNKTNLNYQNAPNNTGYYFGPFHGSHVINDYLSTHNNLTFEQVRDLALNIATTDSFALHRGVTWSKVGPFFAAAVQAYPNANRLGFLGLIQAWDGHFVAGGPSQWAMGTSAADAWVFEEAWVKNMIKFTFSDELGPDNVTPDNIFVNMLIHGLEGSQAGLPWHFNWFADHANVGLPTDPQQLIVLAMDATMQQLGAPPYNQPRGVITYTHELLGPIHTMPYSNRSTYAHCVEFSSAGPTRVESMFPLGESGFIGMDGQGHPVFDPNFFSMAPVFDPFTPRNFPPPQ